MMRRSNPFEELDAMMERMSRQFDEMGRRFDESGMLRTNEVAVDVTDEGETVAVVADLPGFEKEDIDLAVANGVLTIRASREMSSEADEGEYLRRERRSQSMKRSISLPEEIDETGARASYTNGVLTVSLPKLSPEHSDDSRRIDID
jgi:HSP20 family protein